MRILLLVSAIIATYVFGFAASVPYDLHGLLQSHKLELLMRACFTGLALLSLLSGFASLFRPRAKPVTS